MKKLVIGIILVFALFISTTYSYSADWVNVAIVESYDYFVDCESFLIEDNNITYWFKQANKEKKLTVLSRDTINCKERTLKTTDIMTYDSDGNYYGMNTLAKKFEKMEIVPESYNDNIRILLCDEDNKPRRNANNFVKTYGETCLRR